MARKVACPTCNGRLPEGAPGERVTCDFCGNHVRLQGDSSHPMSSPGPAPAASVPVAPPAPEDWAPAARGVGSPPSPRGRGTSLAVVIVAVLLLTGAVVAALVLLAPTTVIEVGDADTGQVVDGQPVRGQLEGGGDAAPPVLVEPGAQGIDLEGQGAELAPFVDIREIGVDEGGNVYVGEFGTGRIVRLDTEGRYEGQWFVADSEAPLTSMVVASDGTVHAQRGFDVFAYDGPTGVLRGRVELAGGGPIQVLQAVAPLDAGGAVLLERVGATTDLVWIDRDGNEVRRVDSGLQPTDRVDRMATDAAGVVHAVGTSVGDGIRNGLWVFEPDGTRRVFLSGEGLGPGAWDLALGLAVDRESRLAVSTLDGVQLYDADLRWIGTLPTDGVTWGLAFEGNRLWGIVDDTVRAWDDVFA